MPEPIISLQIALSRLVELAEYEIESPACPDPPEGWQHSLKEATTTARKFLAEIREPPGAFFLSPDEKRHKLNKSAKENDMSHEIIRTSKKQQNSSSDFQSEIARVVRRYLSGEGGPVDESHWLVKEIRALEKAKTKDVKPAQPHPLFQTGYLGGTPPIAGGSPVVSGTNGNGSKSKEAPQPGIGLLDGFFAANQKDHRRR